MTVVVDASLALKWVLPEDHTDEAVALRTRWHDGAESLIAPPVFRPEVTNALHKRVRRGDVSRVQASEAVVYLTASVTIREPPDLYTRAFALAGELRLGAVYDALYVALAESEGCELWTADRRLVRSAQAQMPQVRWVGEVSVDSSAGWP